MQYRLYVIVVKIKRQIIKVTLISIKLSGESYNTNFYHIFYKFTLVCGVFNYLKAHYCNHIK